MVELDDPTYKALFSYTRALSVALEFRDAMTQLHSERVRGLAEALGRRCGLSQQEIGILRISASFHDIGKVGIPDRVLLKPERFDDAEWACMKEHSAIGEKIIAAIDLEGSGEAALAIRQHHEYFNGRGYPDGLGGDEISLHARIITIVDSYDAMAETRVYHRAKTHAEIMEILRAESGIKHDPELLQIFCDLIDDSRFRTG